MDDEGGKKDDGNLELLNRKVTIVAVTAMAMTDRTLQEMEHV
jgi:hypothetical protein